MMSITHIAIGTVMPLLAAENTPIGIAIAISGAALGGVLADIDLLKSYKKTKMQLLANQ